MKKRICILIGCLFLLSLFGCSAKNRADITPNPKAVENICIQRTNIDEKNEYTYFEKNISDPGVIRKFCSKLDKLSFDTLDPTEFTSVDYLIVFEGGKRHKLLISGNEIIYDGLAYKCSSGNLNKTISSLYLQIAGDEQKTESKIFK